MSKINLSHKSYLIFSDYFRQHANLIEFETSSWIVLSPIEQQIKKKIEEKGIPLKEWDIRINYGIKTGYNEAFIINGAKRDELIQADPKSDEIIRPLLRGRDIKRYSYDFADLYIITTFPSLKIDIDEYPAIKAHLLSFGYDRLKQTGDKGSRKKTNNKWFETQDSISYWEDFYEQKIVWARLMRISKNEKNNFPRFSLVQENMFTVDSLCIITGKNLEFLIRILNSNVAAYYFFNNIAILDNGGMQMRQQYIENFPIPKSNNYLFPNLQNCDNSVFQLYGLTEEEINFISEFLDKKYEEITISLSR